MTQPQIPGFKLEGEIGHGGMSTVYLAEQESLGRKVAVKVMSPALAADRTFSERFIREARTAAQLSHPNIVPAYKVGAAGHYHYLALEYIRGGDLKQRIQRGPISPNEALKVVKDIAQALDYAHGKGFVHRDVKPENILFREDGSAVLTDFGIAKMLGSTTRMTGTGMSIGTPHYMSPEQARGQDVDGRSDLYSLGVVLFEMLTGRVPYDAPDTFAVGIMHINDPVPELPESLSVYQPLIDRLMAKDPRGRYRDFSVLLRAVEELEAGRGLTRLIPTPEPVPPMPPPGTRRNWLWGLGGGLLALMLVLLVWQGQDTTTRVGPQPGGPATLSVRGANSVAKSDLRNAATTQEAFYVDNGRYTKSLEDLQDPAYYGFRLSDGVWLKIVAATGEKYLMEAGHHQGDATFHIEGPLGTVMKGSARDVPSWAEEERPREEEARQAELARQRQLEEERKRQEEEARRAGEIARDGRFIAYDDGTVLDTSTNLMWAAKDNGSDIDWHDAKRYCESYRGGWHTDWRMPTLDELAGLYDRRRSYIATQSFFKAHLTELIQLSTGGIWTSNTRGSDAADFRFGSGARYWPRQSYAYSIRALPVRSLGGEAEGRKRQDEARLVEETKLPKRITNSLGMQFVWIPPGEYMRGSSKSAAELVRRYSGEKEWEKGWYKSEHPQHRVIMTKGFYMQTTEVTVGQWRRFAKETGYRSEAERGEGAQVWTGAKWEVKKDAHWDNPWFSQGEDHPVTCVTWNDANKLLEWMNRKGGERAYRLPTEAEWEYAARAGSTTDFSFGDDDRMLGEYAWYEANSRYRTHPVGTRKPNAWGLYDMHGNVWEWVQDWYGSYPKGAVTDPSGPSSGTHRVLRGGSRTDHAGFCRSTHRLYTFPDYRYSGHGFRLVVLQVR